MWQGSLLTLLRPSNEILLRARVPGAVINWVPCLPPTLATRSLSFVQ